jgi:hypothetical protein
MIMLHATLPTRSCTRLGQIFIILALRTRGAQSALKPGHPHYVTTIFIFFRPFSQTPKMQLSTHAKKKTRKQAKENKVIQQFKYSETCSHRPMPAPRGATI